MRDDTGLIILAGGRGRRMGEPKAFLTWGRSILLEAIVRRATEVRAISDIIVSVAPDMSARAADALQSFPTVRIVTDAFENVGPAGGLYSALRSGSAHRYAVAAVDMPFYEVDVCESLLREDGGARAKSICIVPLTEWGAEPLAGIYATSAADTIRYCIEEGVLRMRDIVQRLQADYVPVHNADLFFRNINTPAEYRAAHATYLNRRRKSAIVSVCATRSNAGKTTVAAELTERLLCCGYTVGAIKTDAHGFTVGKTGSDTERMEAAGAQVVAIVSPKRCAVTFGTEAAAEAFGRNRLFGAIYKCPHPRTIIFENNVIRTHFGASGSTSVDEEGMPYEPDTEISDMTGRRELYMLSQVLPVDVVIIETRSRAILPAIEVRPSRSEGPSVSRRNTVTAVVGFADAALVRDGVPTFGRNDADGLFAFVRDELLAMK